MATLKRIHASLFIAIGQAAAASGVRRFDAKAIEALIEIIDSLSHEKFEEHQAVWVDRAFGLSAGACEKAVAAQRRVVTAEDVPHLADDSERLPGAEPQHFHNPFEPTPLC